MLTNSLIARFDPFGWLENWISGYYLHRLIRLDVIAVSIMFLIHRIARYQDFLVKPLWVVETIILLAILVSYAVRTEPLERSRGFREIVIPLIGAMIPFGLLLTPPSFWIAYNIYALYAVFYWMTATTSLTLWGIWTLRRSFSITVGAYLGDKRALPLVEAPDLPGRDTNSMWRIAVALFPAESGYLHHLHTNPNSAGQMGRRKTYEIFLTSKGVALADGSIGGDCDSFNHMRL